MDIAQLLRRLAASGGWTETRRVFPSWSIDIPPSFDERFVERDRFWHSWDDARSVSLTSMTIDDERGRPVGTDSIIEKMRPFLEGDPVNELPSGVIGWATTARAPQPARASRMLQGMLATDGRVLLVTITCDDLDWARGIWLSIRHHPQQVGPQRRLD